MKKSSITFGPGPLDSVALPLVTHTATRQHNPLMTNEFTHYYHLGESTVIFRGVRSDFEFLFHFSTKFFYANRIAPDVTPPSAASHLGLYSLPMSHNIRLLAYDVAVFQWITSCNKRVMTTRVLTLLREYVTSLTASITTV